MWDRRSPTPGPPSARGCPRTPLDRSDPRPRRRRAQPVSRLPRMRESGPRCGAAAQPARVHAGGHGWERTSGAADQSATAYTCCPDTPRHLRRGMGGLRGAPAPRRWHGRLQAASPRARCDRELRMPQARRRPATCRDGRAPAEATSVRRRHATPEHRGGRPARRSPRTRLELAPAPPRDAAPARATDTTRGGNEGSRRPRARRGLCTHHPTARQSSPCFHASCTRRLARGATASACQKDPDGRHRRSQEPQARERRQRRRVGRTCDARRASPPPSSSSTRRLACSATSRACARCPMRCPISPVPHSSAVSSAQS